MGETRNAYRILVGKPEGRLGVDWMIILKWAQRGRTLCDFK
jgi:hypothetical protein